MVVSGRGESGGCGDASNIISWSGWWLHLRYLVCENWSDCILCFGDFYLLWFNKCLWKKKEWETTAVVHREVNLAWTRTTIGSQIGSTLDSPDLWVLYSFKQEWKILNNVSVETQTFFLVIVPSKTPHNNYVHSTYIVLSIRINQEMI
jgi:hypothetical protein